MMQKLLGKCKKKSLLTVYSFVSFFLQNRFLTNCFYMVLCCDGPDLKVEPAQFSLDLLEIKFLGDDSNS